jgi:hypothetical protein
VDLHDIWGKLREERHFETSTSVLKSLNELTESTRKYRSILEFDETHTAEKVLRCFINLSVSWLNDHLDIRSLVSFYRIGHPRCAEKPWGLRFVHEDTVPD